MMADFISVFIINMRLILVVVYLVRRTDLLIAKAFHRKSLNLQSLELL